MSTDCTTFACPSARTLARRQEKFEAAEKRAEHAENVAMGAAFDLGVALGLGSVLASFVRDTHEPLNPDNCTGCRAVVEWADLLSPSPEAAP